MAPSATMARPAGKRPRNVASLAFVASQPEPSLDALFSEHTAWMRLPAGPWSAIRRVQELTNWSFRDLAEVIGTSHTTIGKLANGARPTIKSLEAVERLEPLLDVLRRISKLVAPGAAVDQILRTPSPSGHKPIEHMMQAQWSEALLASLDVVNGPRPRRPRSLGTSSKSAATQELH